MEECRLHKLIKDDPNIIREYFKTGKKPSMSSAEKRLFLNIIELFRSIKAVGKLDFVLGRPDILAQQLSLFE